jgi:hypothetical protein
MFAAIMTPHGDVVRTGGELRAGYRHDVFLSYSRVQQWPAWVDRIFLPVIEHWLSAELGRDVVVFQDVRSIEPGQNWPSELEQGLAASRVMITLWSKTYFRSEWCRRELAALMARADQQRARGLSGQIIFPLAIHDSTGDDVPRAARKLQLQRIQRYADPFTHPDSPLREELSRELRQLCHHAAREISRIPDESFVWPTPDYSSYLRNLDTGPPDETGRPSLGGVP